MAAGDVPLPGTGFKGFLGGDDVIHVTGRSVESDAGVGVGSRGVTQISAVMLKLGTHIARPPVFRFDGQAVQHT